MQEFLWVLRRLTTGLAVAGVVALGSIVLAAPQSGASANTSEITFAEAPGTAPDYIFPFATLAHFGNNNTVEFQQYMYRPLYWFGTGSKPVLNQKLSLAPAPKASTGNKVFVVTLKTYKWSDGEKLVATDVVFWMNIWHQKPSGFEGWFPGGLSMPTSVQSIKITTPTKLTFTFKQAFNPHWLLYNEFAEITPMPLAWTRTSLTAPAGSAGCAKAAFGTDDSACKAVYVFLSTQSGFNPTAPTTTINALTTFATSPLWSVVDGPWKLQTFGPTAPAVLVPNPTYSGPNKPAVKKFVELPFTTVRAEFNALVGGQVDWGYLPDTEITSSGRAPTKATQTPQAGKNNPRLAGTFDLVPVADWEIGYFLENFNSTGDTGNAGPIFHQLYFRQALQLLVTQTLYIDRLEKGYAVPTYGPVPVWPHNSLVSKFEESNPYPYSPTKAKALLKDHGWKVVPGGVSTCQRPGSGPDDCGKGIAKGAKLDFTIVYVSGTVTLRNLMEAERSSWLAAGITTNLSSATADSVIGTATLCGVSATTKATCKWEMANYGFGWSYSPDFYPSGTEIFASGAGANSGDFDTSHNDALISKTEVGDTSLTKYENWLAKVLPVVWQPAPLTLNEVRKGLDHPPISSLYNSTPATWHWKG